jgi:hypothetical protein
MNKIALTLFLFFTYLIAFSQGPLIGPGAAYVKFLGYKYETRKDSVGKERSVCVFPDGSECDAGAFYKGYCGQKFSYCALKGCNTISRTEDKEGYKNEYTVCCCIDSSGLIQEIPLNDFMTQHGDNLFDFQMRGCKKKEK